MSRAGSQVLCLLSILIYMSIVFGTAIREVYKVNPADYKPISVGGNVSCSKERGSEFPHASIQAGISTGEAALQDDHSAGRSMFLQLAEDEFYDVYKGRKVDRVGCSPAHPPVSMRFVLQPSPSYSPCRNPLHLGYFLL